jgi:WXG100 family type VII secretion target
MAGPFEVDHATLHTAANDVRSTRSEVDGELKKLWNVVDDLAIAWQGSASTGFQNLMNQWNQDTEKLQQALDNLTALVRRSRSRDNKSLHAFAEAIRQLTEKFQF